MFLALDGIMLLYYLLLGLISEVSVLAVQKMKMV